MHLFPDLIVSGVGSNQRLATGGALVAVPVLRRRGMDILRDLLERGESFEKGGSFGGWGEIEYSSVKNSSLGAIRFVKQERGRGNMLMWEGP